MTPLDRALASMARHFGCRVDQLVGTTSGGAPDPFGPEPVSCSGDDFAAEARPDDGRAFASLDNLKFHPES